MSVPVRGLTWSSLLWILPLSSAAVAAGAAAGAALCGSAAATSSWFAVDGPVWGPWLTTNLSLCAGRDARAQLPALALLSGGVASFLSLAELHAGLLALTLFAWASVAIASFYRRYELRLVSSVVCGAGIAALHAFGSTCGYGAAVSTSSAAATGPLVSVSKNAISSAFSSALIVKGTRASPARAFAFGPCA